jgi:hypothetical protein
MLFFCSNFPLSALSFTFLKKKRKRMPLLSGLESGVINDFFALYEERRIFIKFATYDGSSLQQIDKLAQFK